MNTDNKDLLLRVRHLLQLSQREMAAEMGITYQYLSQMERGSSAVSQKTVEALWCVVDAHGARDAVEGRDNNTIVYMYRNLPADQQTHIAEIIRALAGAAPSPDDGRASAKPNPDARQKPPTRASRVL